MPSREKVAGSGVNDSCRSVRDEDLNRGSVVLVQSGSFQAHLRCNPEVRPILNAQCPRLGHPIQLVSRNSKGCTADFCPRLLQTGGNYAFWDTFRDIGTRRAFSGLPSLYGCFEPSFSNPSLTLCSFPKRVIWDSKAFGCLTDRYSGFDNALGSVPVHGKGCRHPATFPLFLVARKRVLCDGQGRFNRI